MAQEARHIRLALALAAGALLLAPAGRAEPGACTGDARIGPVVALSGDAAAVAAGQPPRALGCNAVLRACEEIVTAPGASLAFLAGDVLVRLGPDAHVRVSGSASAPALFVVRGAVRSTDGSGRAAESVRLRSRELAAVAASADTELEARPADGPTRLCAYAGEATVAVGESSRRVAAGHCLAAKGGGVATFAAPGEPALGREAAGFCGVEVAGSGSAPSEPRPGEPLVPVAGGGSR
jgi:hypothetical protein